jgi:hypothetical protein
VCSLGPEEASKISKVHTSIPPAQQAAVATGIEGHIGFGYMYIKYIYIYIYMYIYIDLCECGIGAMLVSRMPQILPPRQNNTKSVNVQQNALNGQPLPATCVKGFGYTC